MRWNFWVGIFISAVLLFLIAWTVDLRESAHALAAADYRWVAPALGVLFASIGLRAWRWRFLLAPVKLIKTHRLLSAMLIGFMGNMLLPARVGEFIRAYVIGRTQRISATASLATVVVERMLDGFTLLTILVATVLILHFPVESERLTHYLQTAGWLALGFYLGVLVFCVFLRLYQAPTRRWVLAALFFLPARWRDWVGGMLDAFVQGLEVVRGGRHLVPIIGLSALAWSIQAVYNWLIFLAFHLDLSLGAAFFLMAVQTFGVMIPSSPGFIGTYHAASILGLAAYGIGQEMALSVSIVMHLFFFIPVILGGFVCLWMENLSFHDVTRAPEKAPKLAAEEES